MWSLALGTESERPHERTQLEGDCRCTVVVAWPRRPKGGNLRDIQARFRRVGGDALSPLPSCAISHPESFVNALAAAGRTSTANQQVRVALASPAQLTRCTRDAWRLTDDELFGLGTAPVPPRNVLIGLFVVDSLRRPGQRAPSDGRSDSSVVGISPNPPRTSLRHNNNSVCRTSPRDTRT